MASRERVGWGSHDHGPRTLEYFWSQAHETGQYSAELAGQYAERLWLTPWPVQVTDSAAEREAAWLEHTTPFEVNLNQRRLRGFTAGDGRTVLLVHGWGDHATRLGAFIEPLVAVGLRVVGITMPAHEPDSTGATSVYEMADAVAAAAKAVGGVDAIIAHSMGVTASTLALRDGLGCTALVGLAVPTMRTEDAFERFGQMLELPSLAMQGLRTAIESRFGPGTWDDVATALGTNPGIPAMVVHDRDDPLVPIDDAKAIAEAWGAPLHATQGLGHQHILKDSTVVAKVTAFLSTLGHSRNESTKGFYA